jgi:predicted ATP-dependent protease
VLIFDSTCKENVLNNKHALSADDLRWRISEDELGFKSTAEVDPAEGVIGQPIALQAMRFGVESTAPAQNIFVRGTGGTGRLTLVRSLLDEIKPQFRRRLDRCYVHNFSQADRPTLITLEAGMGPVFRRDMKELANFIEHRLQEILESEPLVARRDVIAKSTQEKMTGIMQPLEKELEENGLRLVKLQSGQTTRTTIFPSIDDKPVPPEELSQRLQSGKLSQEQYEEIQQKLGKFGSVLNDASRSANKLLQGGMAELLEFNAKEARETLELFCDEMIERCKSEEVRKFIDTVIEDVVENRLNPESRQGQPPPQLIYGVNVICSRNGESGPVVTENSPSVSNLLGTIEPQLTGKGQTVTNHMGIRAGALIHADGGYLILDAHDVLSESGSWRVLMRALRTGCAEIVPPEMAWPFGAHSLKPQAVDIHVRIILIGSSGLYYQLDQSDQDFSNLFKVLADFDSEIERSVLGISQYAGVVARICRDEKLTQFDAGGVAALAEHGARIAARKGKITARFGRVADIVREAAFLAAKNGSEQVQRSDVEETITRTKFRASLPSTRFQELINDGTIMIHTAGEVIGQINGLAVISAGPLSYGFPARITATIGPGRAGIIDIEGAASLSGSIHTKGFQILGGLLRHLLQTDHPLAFSASIAFEQSYGGIDGDSASGAEICCLLSALTRIPLHQSLAMTGAIDQHGHLQAIGGVNEKIEGFFDACKSMGLTGEQGVVIPLSNAGDLMLRQDVVDACREGQFAVFAVRRIVDALEVLTGIESGQADENGAWPETSVLGIAQRQASEFWHKSHGMPSPNQDSR